MANSPRYFVLNKTSDFNRGFGFNMMYDDERGFTIADNTQKKAVFYSRVFDSHEKQTVWYRMVSDIESYPNTSVKITFYASDGETIIDNAQRTCNIYEIISDENISDDERQRIFSACTNESFVNPYDNLFKDLSGRYIWLRIELVSVGGLTPCVHKIKFFIKSDTWLKFLPEIYQEDKKSASFTERYLGVFQQLYEQMTFQIDNSAASINPDVTSREFLEWIAEWFSISDSCIWSDDKLRKLIKNAVNLYRRSGTRQAVSDVIELYTGSKPVIIERCQIESDVNTPYIKSLYERLYGRDSYTFTVLINPGDIKTNSEYKSLVKIIESVKPAHMDANIIVLKPRILLDRYSYAGINTYLGKYESAEIDGRSAMEFTALSLPEDNERRG